jgi:hypothetical protein
VERPQGQRSAQDAFERMFTFKWTPPGPRPVDDGHPLVMDQRNSAALQNCAFVSTADMTKWTRPAVHLPDGGVDARRRRRLRHKGAKTRTS